MGKKNVFSSVKDFVNKPKRNTFDLSFQNNLTMKFGRLYPVFCKEVLPGDSMRIKPTFGLRFMPLVFPVQTRMQANLHFFYVRNRNLWKDWPDFIGRTKSDLVPPYLSPSVVKKIAKTGALGDYFGLPTTLVGDYGSVHSDDSPSILWNFYTVPGNEDSVWSYNYMCAPADINATSDAPGALLDTIILNTRSWNTSDSLDDTKPSYAMQRVRGVLSSPFDMSSVEVKTLGSRDRRVLNVKLNGSLSFSSVANLAMTVFVLCKDPLNSNKWRVAATQSYNLDTVSTSEFTNSINGFYNEDDNLICLDLNTAYGNSHFKISYDMFGISGGNYDTLMEKIVSYSGSSEIRLLVGMNSYLTPSANHWSSRGVNSTMEGFASASILSLDLKSTGITDISDTIPASNPYATGDIKVSSLPFRAYESIYNAFYRNQFNDPFVLDGKKEFNKFITNDEGGEDSVNYDFFNRNWENDFLTSAKQSPVDGDITPLVGVTGTGVFTFQNSDGSQVNITPKYDTDGTTIIGIEAVDGNLENNSSIRRLMDMASVGISINDFRNVNALQRWLETNLRRGYRYKDQLMSHFGVNAKFNTLDMPEFIGGMSEPVIVNQISQSVDQTGNPDGLGDFSKVLGSFAGQASVLAQSNHDVEKYCDEHGFIIGILSVTPVPNYSQLLPKMFTKDNVLDYYFPEFGHIGNQPIPYREVCPLQSYVEGDSLEDVFGYQRAWYDYLASVDEVHGDFRTSLDGFLINRVFDTRPELGKDFIQVDSETISNPFSVTGTDDKILGQVYFDVTAQRPIPKFGIPRLE